MYFVFGYFFIVFMFSNDLEIVLLVFFYELINEVIVNENF